MASTGLLALIDDIATLLDDIAILTKVSAKKTAGVLGDDLALNAEQVSGIRADREIPVVWAVAKGSLLNKVILVPGALLISSFIPWLITPLLMLGGLYLCFEGYEKVVEKFFHQKKNQQKIKKINAILDPNIDLVEFEKKKIKGAIRTDFILSAEIIIIVMGIVQSYQFSVQVIVLCVMALALTVITYGLVAAIVKLDDLGLYLSHSENNKIKQLGFVLIKSTPYLMKTLSVVGTIAMFLVGGGIIAHGIPFVHHFISEIQTGLSSIVENFSWMIPPLLNGLFGFVCGGVVAITLMGLKKIKSQLGLANKLGF